MGCLVFVLLAVGEVTAVGWLLGRAYAWWIAAPLALMTAVLAMLAVRGYVVLQAHARRERKHGGK